MKKYQRKTGDMEIVLCWWKVIISVAVTLLMLGLALYHNDLFKKFKDIYISSGWKQMEQTQNDNVSYQLDFKAKYKYLTSVHILFDLDSEDSYTEILNIELVNTETGEKITTVSTDDGLILGQALEKGKIYSILIETDHDLELASVSEVKFSYAFNGWGAYLCIAVFTMLLGIIFSVELQSREQSVLWKRIQGGILMFTPLCTFLIVETITESLSEIEPIAVLFNIIFYYVIYAVVFTLSNRARFTTVFLTILFVVYGVAEHYVVTFRTTPIVPYDIFSIKTAMTVAGGYQYTISEGMWVGLLAAVDLLLLLRKCQWQIRDRKKRWLCAGGVIVGSACYIGLFYTVFIDAVELWFYFWNPYQTYTQYGCVVSDFLYFSYMDLDKPEGYSKETAEAILQCYDYSGEAEAQKDDTSEGAIVPDDILVIMNESWADLSCAGDFETNIPYNEFYTNLTENTIKGTACVSIYGGNTPQSEYEFLTGNTISFLPSGAIAYNLYIKKDTPSLVSQLSEQGYECIAMHPEKATNFNRNQVYPRLGFSQFLTEDDFTDVVKIRELCSDQSVYDKMIDLYENKQEGQKLFLYGVTMQNHGGYTYEGEDFTPLVQTVGLNKTYDKVNQYLTCMRYTDEALENLIGYFSDVDEHVMIVMFGDHHGDVGSDFYEELYGKKLIDVEGEQYETRYETPFFIWTNYEIGEKADEKISLNYLSTLAMQTANIPLTEYQSFLAELQSHYPVISAAGIYDAEDNFYTWNNVEESADYSYMKEYQILEYYMLENYKK